MKKLFSWITVSLVAFCASSSRSVGSELEIHQAKPIQAVQYSLGPESGIKPNSSKKVDRAPYELRIGDKLKFELLNSGYAKTVDVTIDNVGSVNLDYINWVEIAGLTLEEATAKIKQLYAKDFFVNPQINLRIVEKAKLKYKILGQVANPGFYEVPPGLEVDLLDAIAIAGGYTRIAGKITFKTPLSDGGVDITTYKLRELTKKSNSEIPPLKGDETIIVGESFF